MPRTLSRTAPAAAEPPIDRVLRLPEVCVRVGVSLATFYRMLGEGSFPRPIPIGRRGVGWQASTVTAWLAARSKTKPHTKSYAHQVAS